MVSSHLDVENLSLTTFQYKLLKEEQIIQCQTKTLRPKYLHVQQHAENVAVVQYSQYVLQSLTNESTSPAGPKHSRQVKLCLL